MARSPSFGTITVKLHLEDPDRREWTRLDLLSIELVSPQPRPNIVVDAQISKYQLTPGEELTISITASNTGEALGAHNLTMTVDGKVEKSWLVVLNPGEKKSLTSILSFAEEGTYSVGIDGKVFTVRVSKVSPARFEFRDLDIRPRSVKVGQSSTISVSVKNTGGQPGACEVTLKVNNQVVETKTVTLNPDESETVSFSYTPASEGTYSIEVDGLTGSLVASKEAEEVTETPRLVTGTLWLAIGAVVAAVLVALAVLILKRKPAPRSA